MSAYYGTGNLVISGSTWTDSETTNYDLGGITAATIQAEPAKPKPETDVEWLRRRVDEMCWKEAA